MDLVRVKGKKQPVAIYELLGKAPADPDLERFLQLYHQGLQLLRQRQWEDSAQAFASASRLRPQDHHSHRYLLLAQQYQADSRPEWQGLSVMREK